MNSIERVKLALNHQEPDRVPLDIAGTGVSQIHATAYRNLCQYLGLSAPEPDPFTAIKGEDSIDWLETYLRESRQWLIES